MEIRELFDKAEDGVLSYEQFCELAKEEGAKFTDLSEGNYVSKKKYEDEIAGKANEITTLNDTLTTRDTDLAELQQKLEEAGVDAEKLSKLTADFDTLKGKYDAESKQYKAQLKKQAYEFAVKDFANGQKFTSKAAKRDFINSMVAKDLKMEGDTILGAHDFVEAYAKENEDAFMKEEEVTPKQDVMKPQFVTSTQGAEDYTPDATNQFMNAMHFTGVREADD